ncbi:DUF4058 family protein [Stenomitos frigidus]|uniref:DUF4058 family protein n=1 Tax=Stenomitos frigidus TaxID=1886765 RepID=UPI003BB6ACF4
MPALRRPSGLSRLSQPRSMPMINPIARAITSRSVTVVSISCSFQQAPYMKHASRSPVSIGIRCREQCGSRKAIILRLILCPLGVLAMPSPFLGMDLYLEQPAFWSSFHFRLIGAMARAIATRTGK